MPKAIFTTDSETTREGTVLFKIVTIPLLISKNILSDALTISLPYTTGGIGGTLKVCEPVFGTFSANTKSKLSPPFNERTKSTAWQFTPLTSFVFATSQVIVCSDPTSHTVESD